MLRCTKQYLAFILYNVVFINGHIRDYKMVLNFTAIDFSQSPIFA